MKNKSTVEDSSNIQELSSRFGSVCWLNMIASGNVASSATGGTSDKDEAATAAGVAAEGGINLPSSGAAAAASSSRFSIARRDVLLYCSRADSA